MKKRLTLLFVLCITGRETDAQEVQGIQHVVPWHVDLVHGLEEYKRGQHFEVRADLGVKQYYNTMNVDLEYERALSRRLGLEIKVPMAFYGRRKPCRKTDGNPIPNKVEGVEAGLQYVVALMPRAHLTMALGVMQACYLQPFRFLKKDRHLITGFSESLVMVLGKYWNRHWHTMLYAGPEWKQINGEGAKCTFQCDLSIHYQWTKACTAGIEYVWKSEEHEAGLLYPQAKFAVREHMELGIAAGIPLEGGPDAWRFTSGITIKL